MTTSDPPDDATNAAPDDATNAAPDDATNAAPDDPTDGGPEYCAYTSYDSRPEREDGGADEDRGPPATGADATGVEARVWDRLDGVEDPEMPVSVVDLGLIYGVSVADGHATVRMTLTYTGCPARDLLRDEVRRAAASAEGVEAAEVELVWSPPWSVEMVTEAGRESLREFGVAL